MWDYYCLFWNNFVRRWRQATRRNKLSICMKIEISRIKIGRNLLSLESLNLIHLYSGIKESILFSSEQNGTISGILSECGTWCDVFEMKFVIQILISLCVCVMNPPLKWMRFTDSMERRFLQTLILESLNFHANSRFVPPDGLPSSPYKIIPKQTKLTPRSCSGRALVTS